TVQIGDVQRRVFAVEHDMCAVVFETTQDQEFLGSTITKQAQDDGNTKVLDGTQAAHFAQASQIGGIGKLAGRTVNQRVVLDAPGFEQINIGGAFVLDGRLIDGH